MASAKDTQPTETDENASSVPDLAPMLRLLHPPPQDGHPQTFVLSNTGLYIGRDSADAEHERISLIGDNRASRRHAHITVKNGTVHVEDLDSKNGTYLNGKRIKAARMADGDVLRIGDSLLLLRYESESLLAVPEVPFLVDSTAMRKIVRRLETLGPREDTVLLLGESGVGKEVMARALHRFSGRPAADFLALNCATIPSELAESHLFGHVAGAFSGARAAQEGYLRAAGQGTIFLDEIGELVPALQPKLLRALEERMVTPVGSTRALPVKARIIAATNVDLRRAIQIGCFRGDLYARLSSVVIDIPPLRTRREEILPLFRRALRPPRPLSARLAEAMLLYAWPLNVRELLQLAAELNANHADKARLDLPHAKERLHLSFAESLAPPSATEKEAPAPSEVAELGLPRETLQRLLNDHRGIISRVAAAVHRSPRQVRRWMTHYGLRKKDYQD